MNAGYERNGYKTYQMIDENKIETSQKNELWNS